MLEWCKLADKDDSELSLHHEFNPSSRKIRYDRTRTLLDYIKSINNPFSTDMTVNSISTGAEIPQNIVDGLTHCLEIGEKSYQDFVETRFQNKEKNLHDTIYTNYKHSRTQPTVKNLTAAQDAADTIRYIDYARKRGCSMLQLLKYELTSTSQFLTTECKDGIKKKKKTDKAALSRELVNQLPQKNGMYSVVLRWQ